MAARKSTKRARGAPRPRVSPGSVFLNVPYDAGFENLLLAYIAATSAFGFTARATLEIPFGQRRLDRILTLIQHPNIPSTIFHGYSWIARLPELRVSTCHLNSGSRLLWKRPRTQRMHGCYANR